MNTYLAIFLCVVAIAAAFTFTPSPDPKSQRRIDEEERIMQLERALKIRELEQRIKTPLPN